MNFEQFEPLEARFVENLKSLGYITMSDIQAQALPTIFEQKDVQVKSKTGSGKTLAFVLGCLHNIDVNHQALQVLIIAPTRELASQIAQVMRKVARCIPNLKVVELCGGTPMYGQIRALNHGVHIAVGTPGRLRDHMGKNTINFSKINTLVLDEADKMLELGFFEEVKIIEARLPKKRQTMLFSATFDEKVMELASAILVEPVMIEAFNQASPKIKHTFYECVKNSEIDTLLEVLSKKQPKSAIIFAKTKLYAREIFDRLSRYLYSVDLLIGDMDQNERTEVLIKFVNTSSSILVATDLAARGLDISHVDMIVNIDLPDDIAQYIHRVGRTSRLSGVEGEAISISARYNLEKFGVLLSHYEDQNLEIEPWELKKSKIALEDSPYQTIKFTCGKKDKIRAGDILGSLVKELGLSMEHIGKIDILDYYSYVALEYKSAKKLPKESKIKGKKVKILFI